MKNLLIAAGFAVVVSLGAGLSTQASNNTVRDCGGSAIVKCGAYTQNELNSGLKSDAKALYDKYNVGIDLAEAKTGTLKSDGSIVVDGQVVATGAETFGRSGSSKKIETVGGTKFYRFDTRHVFKKDTAVFVFFNKDGTFKSAFAKMCGNPVIAKPKATPKYSCKNLSVDKISRTSFKFKAEHYAQHATHKSTTYVVRDSSGKAVYSGTESTFSTNTPGTYTVEAQMKFKVNGKTVTVTDKNCKKSFTVEKPPVKDIKVCELATWKVVTIKETEFNKSKHSKDLKNCKPPVKEIELCELETKEVIKIKENEFDSSKHSENLDDCELVEEEPEQPEEPEVPEQPEEPKGEGKIEEPEVPAELPKTGLSTGFLTVLLGALGTYATVYRLRK